MIEGGRLFAIPYDMNRGPAEKSTILLDHLCDHPMWFASSLTPEERRVNAAWMAADASFFKYEVWNGGRLAGMLFLSRVVAPVDALFHFTFLPKKESGVGVFGTHKLIWNFLGYAFKEFGLQRISMEIPESAGTFLKYVRQRLSFKYESELSLERFERLKLHLLDHQDSMLTHIASFGSRREACHWNGEGWSDVMLLRLLRSEYEARASLAALPVTRESTSQDSDVTRLQTGTV